MNSDWANRVAANVAAAPPLTPQQRDVIASLLTPVAIPVARKGAA